MVDFLFNANTMVGIGAVIFSITYFISQILRGNTQGGVDLAKLYKEQRDEQTEINKGFQAKITAMTHEMGEIRGINTTLQKQLDQYNKLLGPAGELLGTLQELREAAKVSNEALKFMQDAREGKLSLTADVNVKPK